ncbi:MAG: hypothetical protein KF890_04815 [Nitrospira sp.]|nr:hypothetical protein [Nitrospira sp.]
MTKAGKQIITGTKDALDMLCSKERLPAGCIPSAQPKSTCAKSAAASK